MKKTRIILSLVMLMVIFGSVSASASTLKDVSVTSDSKLTIIKDDSGNTRIEGACPYGNGVCQAVAHGTAYVYINGILEYEGSAWQCANCLTVYGTEFDPNDTGGNAGKFVSVPLNYEINENGAIVYTSSYTTITNVYTQLPGIDFIY
ncbi:MAG: hypothetical protein U9Q80_09325 [Bacillota bacterium]|nr:hypothetical protein [Bacillota bacterium]